MIECERLLFVGLEMKRITKLFTGYPGFVINY